MPKRTFWIIFTILSLIFLTFAGYFSLRSQEFRRRKGNWSALAEKVRQETELFAGEAAIVLKDLTGGWEIEINPKKLFPAASLAKIPIMAGCYYAVNEGRLKLREVLRLGAKDKVYGSGNLKYLLPPAEFSVQRLIELMIAESDNTATNMLISRLGFDYLNETFKKIGLRDTNISRKMMDFRKRRQGVENFTTASDLAFLLEEIYRQRFISARYSKDCLEFLKKQKIRDRIPAKLPSDTSVAHKTGLERGVCHDAGIVYTPKGNFLICVLTRHTQKNSRRAKNFIAQIAFLVYNYYQGDLL